MKLKAKFLIGALGGAMLVATPAILLASCNNPTPAPYSNPTRIKTNGLSAFEGAAKNPTTALASSKISASDLTLTLTASADVNKFLGLTLPTTLAQFEGFTGFTNAATITWAINDEPGKEYSKNFEINGGKLINKNELSTVISVKLNGTITGNVDIGGKSEQRTSQFTLSVNFSPTNPGPVVPTETTAPTAMTKTGLTAKQGTTKAAITAALSLDTATFSKLSATIKTTTADNKFISLTLPNTIGDTFTGATGFTKAASIAWELKTGGETNFEFDKATRVLTNKADLNTTGVTATLSGRIEEVGKKTQTFEITIKFVLFSQ